MKISEYEEWVSQCLDPVPIIGKLNRWCNRHWRAVVVAALVAVIVLLGLNEVTNGDFFLWIKHL